MYSYIVYPQLLYSHRAYQLLSHLFLQSQLTVGSRGKKTKIFSISGANVTSKAKQLSMYPRSNIRNSFQPFDNSPFFSIYLIYFLFDDHDLLLKSMYVINLHFERRNLLLKACLLLLCDC